MELPKNITQIGESNPHCCTHSVRKHGSLPPSLRSECSSLKKYIPENVNPHCKVYVEDYVISYIKQLNQSAGDRAVGVALYGIGREAILSWA